MGQGSGKTREVWLLLIFRGGFTKSEKGQIIVKFFRLNSTIYFCNFVSVYYFPHILDVISEVLLRFLIDFNEFQ